MFDIEPVDTESVLSTWDNRRVSAGGTFLKVQETLRHLSKLIYATSHGTWMSECMCGSAQYGVHGHCILQSPPLLL